MAPSVPRHEQSQRSVRFHPRVASPSSARLPIPVFRIHSSTRLVALVYDCRRSNILRPDRSALGHRPVRPAALYASERSQSAAVSADPGNDRLSSGCCRIRL